jgi:ABC-type phosphate transport system permease subunit
LAGSSSRDFKPSIKTSASKATIPRQRIISAGVNMKEPVASHTVTIFQYAMGPYDDWHVQAWAASFVITMVILLITFLGSLIIKWRLK